MFYAGLNSDPNITTQPHMSLRKVCTPASLSRLRGEMRYVRFFLYITHLDATRALSLARDTGSFLFETCHNRGVPRNAPKSIASAPDILPRLMPPWAA